MLTMFFKGRFKSFWIYAPEIMMYAIAQVWLRLIRCPIMHTNHSRLPSDARARACAIAFDEQKEGLGFDKAVEECKYRMSRYGVTPNMLILPPQARLTTRTTQSLRSG